MLNLLNILLFVGLTNFFTTTTPLSNLEGIKPTTTQSVTEATLQACSMEVVQGRLAAYYGVPNENIAITVEPEFTSFTMDQKGNIIKGYLHFDNCGVDCTTVYVKSNLGGFVFNMPCNFNSNPSGGTTTAQPTPVK